MKTKNEIINELESALNKANKKNELLALELEKINLDKKRSAERRLFILKSLGGQLVLGSKLKESLVNIFKGNITKEAIADLVIAVFYRFTRFGIIALLISIIPIILLWQQNRLLSTQNKLFDLQNQKIDKQNIRLDQQTNLLEAERRSALVFETGNVLDAISNEIQKKREIENKLSPTLTGRIISLSRSLKPYKYLENDSSLTKIAISPERGQLLISIQESQLHEETIIALNRNSDFSFSELVRAQLYEANLKEAFLRNSDLSKANLNKANLFDTYLDNSNLEDAYINEVEATGVFMFNCNLENAEAIKSNFYGAKLNDSNFKSGNFKFSNFTNASLINAKLDSADFSDADFSNSLLYGVTIKGTIMKNAIFESASAYIYQKEDFMKIGLTQSQLQGIKFDKKE